MTVLEIMMTRPRNHDGLGLFDRFPVLEIMTSLLTIGESQQPYPKQIAPCEVVNPNGERTRGGHQKRNKYTRQNNNGVKLHHGSNS